MLLLFSDDRNDKSQFELRFVFLYCLLLIYYKNMYILINEFYSFIVFFFFFFEVRKIYKITFIWLIIWKQKVNINISIIKARIEFLKTTAW